jgi:hypothetical protein
VAHINLCKGTYSGSSGLVSSLLFLQKTPRRGLETEAASSHETTGEARAPWQRRRFQQCCTARLSDSMTAGSCARMVVVWRPLLSPLSPPLPRRPLRTTHRHPQLRRGSWRRRHGWARRGEKAPAATEKTSSSCDRRPSTQGARSRHIQGGG